MVIILERYPEASNNLLRAILVSSSDVPREIELQVEKLEDTETFIDMLQPSFRLNAKGKIKSNKKKMLH